MSTHQYVPNVGDKVVHKFSFGSPLAGKMGEVYSVTPSGWVMVMFTHGPERLSSDHLRKI